MMTSVAVRLEIICKHEHLNNDQQKLLENVIFTVETNFENSILSARSTFLVSIKTFCIFVVE